MGIESRTSIDGTLVEPSEQRRFEYGRVFGAEKPPVDTSNVITTAAEAKAALDKQWFRENGNA